MNISLAKHIGKCWLAAAMSFSAVAANSQTAAPFGFEDNTLNGWAGTASSETVAVNNTAANVRTGAYSLKLTTTSTGTGNKQWYSNTPTGTSGSGVYIHFVYWAKAQDAGTSVDASLRYATTSPPSGTGSSNNASNDFALSTTGWKRVINMVNTSSVRYYFPAPRKTVSAGATSFYLDDGIIYTSASSTTDTAKPLAAGALAGTVSGNLVSLGWTPGTDTGAGASGIAATIVLRTTNLTAAAPELNDQAIYSVAGGAAGPNTAGAWTIVSTTTGPAAVSYMDATPAPGTYKYAVVLRDLAHNYSAAAVSANITAGLPVPTVFTDPSGFNGNMGNTLRGQFSAESSYLVSGLNLTAPLTVSAPAGFQVSLTTGTGFASSLSLPPVSGTVSATRIFVRFAPAGATGSTGNQTIANTSGSAAVNVTVSGNAIDLEPTTTGSISFGVVRSTRISVNLPTTGGGSKRIIVVSSGADVSFIPTDGTAVSGVNADFSAATDQGSGNKVVYDGSGSGNEVVLVTGLTPGTTYYFAVYEYNAGSGSSQNYLPNSPITAIARTADNDLAAGGAVNTGTVRFFPNPAREKIYINATLPVNACLRSMDGRLLFQGAAVKEIDLGAFAAGSYLLQLSDVAGRLLKTERVAVVK